MNINESDSCYTWITSQHSLKLHEVTIRKCNACVFEPVYCENNTPWTRWTWPTDGSPLINKTKETNMKDYSWTADTVSLSISTSSLKDMMWKLFILGLTIMCLCLNIKIHGNPDICKWRNKSASSFDAVFKFNVPFKQTSDVYHFSLKNYLSEKEGNQAESKLMRYEWARYESFSTFPKESRISSIRLTQSGFYYKGKGLEAICFKCGLKNSTWPEEETVTETHKRLAPKCEFMNGLDTDNVPIHKDVSAQGSNTGGGACGGPTDLADYSTGDVNGPNNGLYDSIKQKENNEDTDTECSRKRDTTFKTNSGDENTEESSQISRRTSWNSPEQIYPDDIERYPGIPNERPKYPDYALKSKRLTSFINWTLTFLTPELLADAGFFFVGVGDSVRCFFCGGGLKSWQHGDCPWTEHARWFPRCAYVAQCRGESFVTMVQTPRFRLQTLDNAALREDTIQIIDDQNIIDLNSKAAKQMFEMGFGQSDIEAAINHVRLRIQSTGDLQTSRLLQYLLDNAVIGNIADTPENGATSTTWTRQRAPSREAIAQSVEDLNNASDEISHSSNAEKTDDSRRGGKTLKNENRELKEQMMCKICMDKDANIVFLPCGHLVSCIECAHALRKCAVCRKIIEGTIRVYPA